MSNALESNGNFACHVIFPSLSRGIITPYPLHNFPLKNKRFVAFPARFRYSGQGKTGNAADTSGARVPQKVPQSANVRQWM